MINQMISSLLPKLESLIKRVINFRPDNQSRFELYKLSVQQGVNILSITPLEPNILYMYI